MLSPNESAIFMLIFISLVAIVGSIYFYYQDKKEEKKYQDIFRYRGAIFIQYLRLKHSSENFP